jgi:hypothetical protein
MPNFEIVGSRYFYRRDPKQNFSVEIELINPQDRLFREVQQPNRYFYLLSFDNLEYSNQIPVMPYYEVTFICNTTFPTNTQAQLPLLSYIDKSFQYTPRYVLDLPLMGTNKQSEMYAYADIFNNGDQSIVIKGAELIAGKIFLLLFFVFSYFLSLGDISLNPRPFGYFRTGLSDILSYQFGEQTSGTYVYQLSLPSSMILPPNSIKSVSFFQPNITIDSFCYYSSVFSPVNASGKLLNAYNLTSFNNFLPNGRLFLREQGRFLGQIDLPDLSMEETYTMLFGFDVDVLYRRQVEIIEGDENSDSITYYVEYVFENFKTLYDVRVYFTESFSLFKYFQIKNISTSNDNKNFPDLISYGTDLRGYILLPRQNIPKIISYNIVTYKFQPIVNFHEQ